MSQSRARKAANPKAADPRAVRILAKNLYREFRASGYSEHDMLSLAGELVSLVTTDVRSRRTDELGTAGE